jgi:hypothetical protein
MARGRTSEHEESTETTESTPSLSLKKELTAMASDIRAIAAVVPTPNVTDSHLHGHGLTQIAERLQAIAADL